MTRFPFESESAYRAASLPFGVRADRAEVVVDDEWLRARFGPWQVVTSRSNVASAEVTGPYQWFKVMGPAHLSLSDRGLTFALTNRRGVCISFHEPVRGIDPLGLLRHPGLTVTVADPRGLVEALGG